jgi:hypothetical protein
MRSFLRISCSGDLRSPSAATGRRYSCALLLAFACQLSARAATDPRAALEAGTKAYGAKQFEAARQAFEQAATNAAAHQLDPAVARYNAAAADYRLGQLDAAADRLAEALRTGDLQLQQKAWFNRGDVMLGRMGQLEQQGKLEDAQKAAAEAATQFEQAILLDPADADAKVNYELCLQLQQELEKKKQEQQQKQDKDKKDQDKQKQDKDKDKDKKDQQDQQKKPEAGQDKDKDKDQQQSKPDEKQQQQQAAQAEKKDGEMTPDEAKQLLNAMRQEEQANREKMRLNLGQPEPVEKDW